MSEYSIVNARTWQEADERFDRFMAALPERRAQLRERLTDTGGPELDGTVEGLDALNEWYIATAMSEQPDGMTWLPEWLPSVDPTQRGFDGERMPSGEVLRLWEMIGIYLGDMALARFPDARWVCWRDHTPRGVNNGEPAIDAGLPRFPLDVLSRANATVPRMYMYAGTGHALDTPSEPSWLREVFDYIETTATEQLAATRPRWQRAPTGPDAHRRTTKRPF